MTATAAEMMRRQVVTVTGDATMGMVEGQMKLQNVHHVCVVDAGGRLAGIVSRGDVLRAREKGEHQFVRDHMTRRIFKVSPGARAAVGLALMLEHDIGAVPVVDEADRVLGMLYGADFLRLALQGLEAGTLPR